MIVSAAEATVMGIPTTALVSGVVALLLGVFAVVQTFLNRTGGPREKRRQAAAEAKAKADQDERARREPGWAEVVAESRQLRIDNGKLFEGQQELRGMITALQENMTRRDQAMARVLRSAADQWPKGSRGPVLDPADLAILEDTIPHQWRIASNPEGIIP
jgi:flagellar biosynthesis/type III secretory pathway M-ring protein FliF/YscJ